MYCFAYGPVNNSTLSAFIFFAPSSILESGSMNIDTLIEFDLNSSTTSFKKSKFLTVSQPELEVIASDSSGTKVT